MKNLNDTITITTSRGSTSLKEKLPGFIAGTSLSMVFALVGAILAMAVQT